jgi:hypothetical protein
MKAKIVNVEQGLIPQFDNSPEVNADVPTVVVLTTVEFWTDEITVDGSVVPPTLYLTQQYGCKPDNYPADNYQGQADAMQADIDHTAIQAAVTAQSQAAAAKVAEVQALINNQPQ